jgi:hypothetical protein
MAEVNVRLPGGGYTIHIAPGGLDMLGGLVRPLTSELAPW